jgi:predicted GNAT family acetyltransferase
MYYLFSFRSNVAELINKKVFCKFIKFENGDQTGKPNKRSIYVEDDKKDSDMEYSMTDNNLMIINHTEVDEILKGKNVDINL